MATNCFMKIVVLQEQVSGVFFTGQQATEHTEATLSKNNVSEHQPA